MNNHETIGQSTNKAPSIAMLPTPYNAKDQLCAEMARLLRMQKGVTFWHVSCIRLLGMCCVSVIE